MLLLSFLVDLVGLGIRISEGPPPGPGSGIVDMLSGVVDFLARIPSRVDLVVYFLSCGVTIGDKVLHVKGHDILPWRTRNKLPKVVAKVLHVKGQRL